MSSDRKNLIWVIPIIAVLALVAFNLFVRVTVGSPDEREIRIGTTPFVPGESPHATGEHSR